MVEVAFCSFCKQQAWNEPETRFLGFQIKVERYFVFSVELQKSQNLMFLNPDIGPLTFIKIQQKIQNSWQSNNWKRYRTSIWVRKSWQTKALQITIKNKNHWKLQFRKRIVWLFLDHVETSKSKSEHLKGGYDEVNIRRAINLEIVLKHINLLIPKILVSKIIATSCSHSSKTIWKIFEQIRLLHSWGVSLNGQIPAARNCCFIPKFRALLPSKSNHRQ